MGGTPYFMPNSIADIGDVDMNGNSPPAAGVGVLRLDSARGGPVGRVAVGARLPGSQPQWRPPFNLVMPTFQQPHPRRLLDGHHRP